MKRPAVAMEPDSEPEVIEWDDPEVLDFDVAGLQTVTVRSESNPADLASTNRHVPIPPETNPWTELVSPDDTDVPEADYSPMETQQTWLPSVDSQGRETSQSAAQSTGTRPTERSNVTPQVDTGASQSVGPPGTNSMFRPAIQQIPRFQRLSNVGRWCGVCADCANGVPPRNPARPDMTDRYVMNLHDSSLEEYDNFIEPASGTEVSSQPTTTADDQRSADEPEPMPGQLTEETHRKMIHFSQQI